MEWHEARLGIPTASRFADVVTPTGRPTKGAAREAYKCQLLVERFTGLPAPNYVSAAMLRGTEQEPQARAWYELTTGRDVRQVGFAWHKERRGKYGCSPDGLCADRGIEIKVPLPHNLIGMVLCDDPPEQYRVQVQACMWICCLPLWDLVLYAGETALPKRIWTIEADAAFHAAMEAAVLAFCDELDAAEARLIELGGVKMQATGGGADDPTADWAGPPDVDALRDVVERCGG